MKLRWVVSFGLARSCGLPVSRRPGRSGADGRRDRCHRYRQRLERETSACAGRGAYRRDRACRRSSTRRSWATETEQQRLFEEYQAQLYSYQQQLVDELLAQVRTIAVVAEELGLSVVLDANGVIRGGRHNGGRVGPPTVTGSPPAALRVRGRGARRLRPSSPSPAPSIRGNSGDEGMVRIVPFVSVGTDRRRSTRRPSGARNPRRSSL